ncbi:MAG TPA: ComEA family DNA-binding protein [Lachnospiraceae bacterium]|nr:ComEA family DNA-binding protein [Lachnospiraceae bacterium]
MNKLLKYSMAIFAMVFILFCGCGSSTAENVASVQESTEDDPAESQQDFSLTASMPPDSESINVPDSGSSFSGSESRDIGKDTDSSATIYVYVCGAVVSPGVYELPGGSRVYQAISMAGGLTDDADRLHVNQAKLLTDGEQVTILTKGEAENAPAGTPDASSDAAAASADGKKGISENGKVNINTADSATLQTLNGIGESRAAAIIAYRETNGAFRTIEDIMKVAGIKTALFNNIKDSICVG